MIDTVVSITVHDRRVSLIDRLKYSLNNQKPPSFRCEQVRLPAPTASTIKLGLMDGSCRTSGDMIPAVVRPATVAEPRLMRMIAAISHPSTKGCRWKLWSSEAISLLAPL